MKLNSTKEGNLVTCSQKLVDQTMIGVVNSKRALVESYADVVDKVIENLQFHVNSVVDPLNEEDGPVEKNSRRMKQKKMVSHWEVVNYLILL